MDTRDEKKPLVAERMKARLDSSARTETAKAGRETLAGQTSQTTEDGHSSKAIPASHGSHGRFAAHSPFSSLSGAELERLAALGTELSYRPQHPFCFQADTAKSCALILSGSFRRILYRSDESQLDLGIAGPGEWLGLPECLIGGPHLYDALAQAHRQTPCRVFVLSQTALHRMLAITSCRVWLAEHLAREQYSLYARVELSTPSQRLAHYLLAHTHEGETRLVMTQEALAEAVSCSRESINRILSRLQLDGCVSLGRGYLEVHREKLSERSM